MRYLHLILLLILISAASCSSNTPDQEQAAENNTEEEVVDTDTVSDYGNDEDVDSDYLDNSGDTGLSERPPKVKRIGVDAVSNDLRDGFLAVVETDESENEDVNFIYQWKHNGADIIGATEQKLDWNDQFKKGDVITLEILPYDDLTKGLWRSEGNFTIPNSPPTISTTPPATINGNTLNYKVDASDLDGDKLTYSLRDAPEGMTIDPDPGEINWEYGPESAGEYRVGIEVDDGDGGQVFQDMSLTVN